VGRRRPLIFALGQLELEFPNPVREQEFLRQHGPDWLPVLEAQPHYLHELTWILTQDGCPLYALRPATQDIYRHLLELKLALSDPHDPIERVSVPGILTPLQQTLRSGQSIPVVHLPNLRGMFGWSTAEMLESVDPEAREGLLDFLERIYGDLENPGRRSRDRALNFAATNVFQAAGSLSEALSEGFELHSIGVEKSPFCRLHSDCWEIQLKFQDPEDCRRAFRVHRFSIDVSDVMPVTIGTTRAWSTRH